MNMNELVSVPRKALRDFIACSACSYKGPEWSKNKSALLHSLAEGSPAPAEKVDERKAFEEEYLNNYLQIPKDISQHFFRRDRRGDYIDRQTRGGWMMWQARARLSSVQP